MPSGQPDAGGASGGVDPREGAADLFGGHLLELKVRVRRRGVCPSCSARRTAETAAFLVDRLLPDAPYRQWVLTVPFRLRMLMIRDKSFLSEVLRAFLRVLFAFQRAQARALGLGKVKTGSVTFVQRAGSAINAHPHFHSLLPDAVYTLGEDGKPRLASLAAPTPEQVQKLTRKIARRVTQLYERRCAAQGEPGAEAAEPALEAALQEATRPTLPLLPSSEEGEDSDQNQRVAKGAKAGSLRALADGFSLHAATHVRAADRERLEYLCRYGARGPLSLERLSLLPDGRLRYTLRRPWPTNQGATSLTFEPVQFLRRLALLIPPPYQHLVRYHGFFGPNSRWHPRVVEPESEVSPGNLDVAATTDGTPPSSTTPPTPEQPDPCLDQGLPSSSSSSSAAQATTSPHPHQGPGSNSRYVPWADLLRRVFAFEILVCGRCAGPMTVISYLTDPRVVHKILTHLGLPTSAPAITPAQRLDVDDPELDFGDYTVDDTDQSAWPSPPVARSPPEGGTQVDADPPADDDSFWGA